MSAYAQRRPSIHPTSPSSSSPSSSPSSSSSSSPRAGITPHSPPYIGRGISAFNEKHSLNTHRGLRERTLIGKLRNFVLRYRNFVLLALFIVLILCSHYSLSSSSPKPTHYTPWNSANLKAINYLNTSSAEGEDTYEPLPNPFSFCPVYGPGDTLAQKYGAHILTQSRIHVGSSDRIMPVLNRAMQGLPVTISVLGGSVSACHGSGDSPLSPTCYPTKFFTWWNSVFPHPATSLTNGAMRRTDSGYYAFCSSHHLPDVSDLVIIELDSEDIPSPDSLDHYEILLRSLLLRPDRPAILLLGHFSPQLHQSYGYAGADHWHNVVAQFYDVPYVSIKSVLWNQIVGRSGAGSPGDKGEKGKGLAGVSKKYFVDPVLPNASGHDLLSDILIHYVQQMTCEVWEQATSQSSTFPFPGSYRWGSGEGKKGGPRNGLFGGVGKPKGVPEPDDEELPPDADADSNKNNKKNPPKEEIDRRAKAMLSNPHVQKLLNPVPPVRINTRPEEEGRNKFEEIKPHCVSANDLVNPLPPSMFYGSGWRAFHAGANEKEKELGVGIEPDSEGGPLRITSHYWYSTLPTSKIRIPIQVGAGDIGVYYMREPTTTGRGRGKGKGRKEEGSAVECWVDDNYSGGRVIEGVSGELDEGRPTLVIIDRHVSRGSHYVECVLLGEEGTTVPAFKILGVFST